MLKQKNFFLMLERSTCTNPVQLTSLMKFLKALFKFSATEKEKFRYNAQYIYIYIYIFFNHSKRLDALLL
jgi:hypothetical protein